MGGSIADDGTGSSIARPSPVAEDVAREAQDAADSAVAVLSARVGADGSQVSHPVISDTIAANFLEHAMTSLVSDVPSSTPGTATSSQRMAEGIPDWPWGSGSLSM